MKKNIIVIITSVIIFALLGYVIVIGVKNKHVETLREIEESKNPKLEPGTYKKGKIEYKGAYIVDGIEVELTDVEYSTDKSGEAVILVVNGGKLTLNNVKVVKDGNSNKNGNGVNSAIVVMDNSKLVINSAEIITKSNGSSAIYSDDKSKVSIDNCKIKTTGNDADGIYAISSNMLEVNNSNIDTFGNNSNGLVGYIKSNNTIVNTSKGYVYLASKEINVSNSKANGLFGKVDNGKLVLEKSTVVTTSSLEVSGKSSININDSSIESGGNNIFSSDNSDTVINLNSVIFKYSGSGLIELKNNSIINLNLVKTEINGNANIDSNSKLNVSLKNNSIIHGDLGDAKVDVDDSSKVEK